MLKNDQLQPFLGNMYTSKDLVGQETNGEQEINL